MSYQGILMEMVNVSKVFKGQDERVHALKNINLRVCAGEIYGIVGMSGAGKSTLIRCMNGLDTPTEGDVFFRGQSIPQMDKYTLMDTRRKIAMIFQQFNLFHQSTVAENVAYPLLISGMKKKEALERATSLLDLVSLADKRNAYPSQLSGGQKQRVAIARALASNPEILLCDEATSALDPMTTQSILDLLQSINRNLGITIILITHEMAVIRQICTKVAILDKGQVVEEGDVDTVFKQTKSEAGKRLFGILSDSPEEDPQEPALRIVFEGLKRSEPIIARMAQQTGFEANILSANMKSIGGKTYGQMLIERPQDSAIADQMTAYLRSFDLVVEEVN